MTVASKRFATFSTNGSSDNGTNAKALFQLIRLYRGGVERFVRALAFREVVCWQATLVDR